MRKGIVFYNGTAAGEITEISSDDYLFHYNDDYFSNPIMPAISLTLPKSKQEYRSDKLFPFFYNLLSEGANRSLQARLLKIDENDNFALLLAALSSETIGAITIKPSKQ